MHAARRTWVLGAALALALVVATGAAASPSATSNVSIVNFAFNPATVKIRLGDSVKWTNTAALTTHTSTSDGTDVCCPKGPSLWASGNIAPNGTFTATFVVAGKYPYHCSIHTTMKGIIQVGMKVSPTTGHLNTTFTITWGVGSIPNGFNADIQISRPGGSFVNWMTNQTGTHVKAPFMADAGTGTYKFRARLQNSSSGGASAFSASKSITVT
jgi:plastocyanin